MSTTSIRPPSQSLRGSSSTQSQPAQSLLQARIAQKRAELDSLKQLRDLSANLTAQLEQLETKLSQLNDGAQSVALVLANWENVLSVIRMAGMKTGDVVAEKAGERSPEKETEEQKLPVPLVRIPMQATLETGG
jgi:DASH complex subunit DAD2